MKICKLTHTCKIAFKSALTVLICISFVLSAVAFEARTSTTTTVVTEDTNAAKKSLLLMVADVEEEVEGHENQQDERFEIDYTGHLFLCGSFVRLNTFPQLHYARLQNTCTKQILIKLPFYILFKRLKIFGPIFNNNSLN